MSNNTRSLSCITNLSERKLEACKTAKKMYRDFGIVFLLFCYAMYSVIGDTLISGIQTLLLMAIFSVYVRCRYAGHMNLMDQKPYDLVDAAGLQDFKELADKMADDPVVLAFICDIDRQNRRPINLELRSLKKYHAASGAKQNEINDQWTDLTSKACSQASITPVQEGH